MIIGHIQTNKDFTSGGIGESSVISTGDSSYSFESIHHVVTKRIQRVELGTI